VLLTRREALLGRIVRAVPMLALALLAFVAERPWLLPAAIAWGLGVIIIDRLHARSLNARLKALAGTLARDGDPHVAARGLEAVVSDARSYPGFHSIALLFLAIARARTGDADRALELLYTVDGAGWITHRDVWMAWLLPWLAALHAARGELELAERWLAVARARLPEGKRESLIGAEALLALRSGRNDEAVARIDAHLQAIPPSDAARTHYALLRAFARERAGRPLPDDEVRAIIADRLAAPGRALPVETWWAELAEYMQAHT